MTGPHPPSAPSDFLSVARRLALLDDKSAVRLEEESRQEDVAPAQLALRHGLLDAVQIDIVETLQNPHDIVPGYEILDLIGQGGMGVVFRARQKSLDRIVAVKTILFSQTHDQTTLSRFEQEALAVARLRHPNIVAAYDLGRAQGRLYFVMELIEGQDMEALIEGGGPIDEATAWGLVRQAAAGLSQAAAAGIIHRDIKPANLLLVEPPAGFELPEGLKMVKITDFGLAFLARDVETRTRLTSANATIGSPHYIAPEQLDGDSFDHRVDIYSLGATAYHMLAGEPPFNAKKLSQIVAQKLSTDSIDMRARFPDVSAASSELIRRMTERDPDRRIGDYAKLLSEIDRLVQSAPRTALKPSKPFVPGATTIIRSDPTPGALDKSLALPAKRIASKNRRRFLITGGAAVLGIGTAGFAAWSYFASRQKPLRALTSAGPETNLFSGLSLSGWNAVAGGWTVKKNDEGGYVLSGSDGSILHSLIDRGPTHATPFRNFRLALVVQLHGATAAQLEFGIDISTGLSGERYVAEVAKDGASVGHRADDGSRYIPESDPRPLPRGDSAPYTLTIERQPGYWWVFLDETQIGVVPIRSRPEAPEFRLRAQGNEVWFSDVVVQKLEPPGTAAGS